LILTVAADQLRKPSPVLLFIYLKAARFLRCEWNNRDR
jgi:hypothetical protein